jgi:hypothetical protein
VQQIFETRRVTLGPFLFIDLAYKNKTIALIGLPTATVNDRAPLPRPMSFAANKAIDAALEHSYPKKWKQSALAIATEGINGDLTYSFIFSILYFIL